MATIQLMERTDQGNTPDRGALQAYYDRILAAERARGAGILPAVQNRGAGFQPAVNEEAEASHQASVPGVEVLRAGKMPAPQDQAMAGKMEAPQDQAMADQMPDAQDDTMAGGKPALRRRHRAAEVDIGEVLRPREKHFLTVDDQRKIYEALLRDAATLEPDPATSDDKAAGRKRGRPARLNAITRARVLRLLELGQTRPQATKRSGLCRSAIGKAMQREPAFARLVETAERQGKEFARVFENLFLPYRVVLEQYHMVSTPLFEREKQLLIEQGLPELWVQRLRAQNCDEWQVRLSSESEWVNQRGKVDKMMALPAADRPIVKRPFKFRKKQYVNRRGQAIEELTCEATYSGGGKNWEQELKRVLAAAGLRRERALEEMS